MGSTLKIIAFDSNIFFDRIISSLKEGEDNEFIKDELQFFNALSSQYSEDPPTNFIGLKSVMNTFNNSMTLSELGNEFKVNSNGEIINNQKSNSCWSNIELNDFLLNLTLKHCARYSITFDRVLDIEDVLTPVNKDHLGVKSQYYISKLDRCGFHYFNESGIKGWLDYLEVKEFINEIEEGYVSGPYLSKLKDSKFYSLYEIIKIASEENLGLLSGRIDSEILNILPSDFQTLVKFNLLDLYNKLY